MLYEELYFTILDVETQARREKVPGPLARSLIDTAHKMIDVWQRDERAASRFAAMVLLGPTSLRETAGRLPPDTAHACWRLIALLEYLSNGRQ